MIGFLEGEILTKSPGEVLVKVGGVGYHVYISLNTFYNLPNPPGTTCLHIHTRIMDDAIELFGFVDPEEKEIFQQLLSIHRIGARLALNILSGITPEEFRAAVAGNDVSRLTSIPGLGRKSAERIALELRDRLAAAAPVRRPAPQEQERQDALSALINLGYAKNLAEKALDKVQAQGARTLEELLRQSLRYLAK
uniref:Holliday junction branch migration complex subunit RuvA n=1 Tax=Desulfobacca acetoxidans TaxID=60893 RepID=A0A7C3V4H4_9BACT